MQWNRIIKMDLKLRSCVFLIFLVVSLPVNGWAISPACIFHDITTVFFPRKIFYFHWVQNIRSQKRERKRERIGRKKGREGGKEERRKREVFKEFAESEPNFEFLDFFYSVIIIQNVSTFPHCDYLRCLDIRWHI